LYYLAISGIFAKKKRVKLSIKKQKGIVGWPRFLGKACLRFVFVEINAIIKSRRTGDFTAHSGVPISSSPWNLFVSVLGNADACVRRFGIFYPLRSKSPC